MKWLAYLGVPGALISAITLWGTMGFPTLATGMDIQNLNRQQADVAIEVYQNKYRSFLALPKPSEPAQEAAWDIEIKRALKQLERAETRKIELSK